MKKNLLYIITFFLLFLPICCFAIVEKSNKEFVTDEAEILNEDSEDYIVRYSDYLYQNKKIDFYVVTVNHLEGKELEEYTDEVFQKFEITKKGMIILVSKDKRQLRVQVGEILLETLTPELIDEYINTYFLPYMEREEWNDGIVNGYSAFYKTICDEYGLDASSMQVWDKLDFLTKYKNVLMILIIWSVAGFTKIYGYFYKQDKLKKKKDSHGNALLFAIVLLGNIFVVSVSYVLKPIFLLFVLVFEAYFLYVYLSPSNPRKSKTFSKKEKKHK